MASPQSILLHTTPPLSPVPASDAKSIYLASLLTLACPGRWQITTAPWSEHAGQPSSSSPYDCMLKVRAQEIYHTSHSSAIWSKHNIYIHYQDSMIRTRG